MAAKDFVRIRLLGGKHDGAVKTVKDPGATYKSQGHIYRRALDLDREGILGYRWVPQNPGVRPDVPRGT